MMAHEILQWNYTERRAGGAGVPGVAILQRSYTIKEPRKHSAQSVICTLSGNYSFDEGTS